MADETLVSVRGLVKSYQALRPLRIEELSVADRQIVSISGLDRPAAEMLVGLLTGALVPDSGEVRLFGQTTANIDDSDAWLAMLDGVGILTHRAVLLDQFSIRQNVAMSFTLDIDPIGPEHRPKVDALAREVGLVETSWNVPVGSAGPDAQARVRLARAITLDPRLLLAEHPSATLPRETVAQYAADIRAIADRRGFAVLAVTADEAFASALGGMQFVHNAATGALTARGFLRRFLRF